MLKAVTYARELQITGQSDLSQEGGPQIRIREALRGVLVGFWTIESV